MTVYVETNFLLELALAQEEADACRRLLTWATSGAVRLVVPAFALVEALSTVRRRADERQSFLPRLRDHLRTLARSATAPPSAAALVADLRAIEPTIRQAEEQGVRDLLDEILSTTQVTVTPLDPACVARAVALASDADLHFEDAVVLASVVRDLESVAPASAVFVNRNSKDFGTPEVRELLGQRGCVLVPSFVDGARYVEARLGRPG